PIQSVLLKNELAMETILGQGAYSFTEAAKLTGLKPGRLREWFRGRTRSLVRQPVFAGDFDPVEGEYAISFLDLIDVYVAGQLRDHGVSLQNLRKVYACLSTDFETRHPFCRQELLSDGKMVFLRGLDDAGQEDLTEVLTKQ